MTATVRRLVWITFEGDPRPAVGSLPRLPDDHGLTALLYAWMDTHGIRVAELARMGSGAFSVGFAPVDGALVAEWLREQGVVVTVTP